MVGESDGSGSRCFYRRAGPHAGAALQEQSQCPLPPALHSFAPAPSSGRPQPPFSATSESLSRPEVAPPWWRCGGGCSISSSSASPVDPESGAGSPALAPVAGAAAAAAPSAPPLAAAQLPPPPPRSPKAARCKRMVRLAAELLLLLGLLLLTLHITVLRSSEPDAASSNHSERQQVSAAEARQERGDGVEDFSGGSQGERGSALKIRSIKFLAIFFFFGRGGGGFLKRGIKSTHSTS